MTLNQLSVWDDQYRDPIQISEIDKFISSQVLIHDWNERTIKAYRLDLEHLYSWIQTENKEKFDKKTVENYLHFLLEKKKLCASTVMRKYRVICYFLDYLFKEGLLSDNPPLLPPILMMQKNKKEHFLSKSEIDSFFVALSREYDDLESDFRKRICLRDHIMMALLFYHGLEISELLRLKLSDYNRKTGVLMIQEKKNKQRAVYLYSKKLRDKMHLWTDEHTYFELIPDYNNWLFLSKLGRPLSMKMVINIFEKYKDLAGIKKDCTPKDLKSSMKRYAKELVVEKHS